ncbi:MAG: hypothetical protein WBP29_14835 [Candidatus Zixiibacteriota bacterium]
MNEQDRVDHRQLKALLKVSIKADLRGANNPFKNYGKGESKFPPILGVIAMQLFVSVVIGALVFKFNDAFFGAFVVNSMVLVFISLTILLEFSNLILSPEDHAIISPHPVNSRTFFAVKALHFLIFISAFAVTMSAFPSIMAAVASGKWWMAPMTFISAFATGLAASLFFILFYTVMLRVAKRETMQHYLGYSQILLMFVIYIGYMVVPRMIENTNEFDIAVLDRWYLYLTPPAWFASWPGLIADGLRSGRLAAALVGILALALMIFIGLSRLSLNYALTLADTVEQQEKLIAVRKRGFFSRFFDAISNNEDRAVWSLIRAQFKYDNRFKTTVLSIIPLTIIYIYLGVSDSGTIIDPFAIIADAEIQKNYFLYLAVAFLPFMIITGTSYSASANASWVFFASPADRTKLILASSRFALIYFCIPYLIFLSIVFGCFFGNYLHAVLHCFILFLTLIAMLQLMVAIMPRIPFSLPARAGQRSLAFFAMFIIPALFIIVPMMIILKFGYGDPVRYLSIVAVFLFVGWLTNWLLKKTAPKRLDKLEYAESE